MQIIIAGHYQASKMLEAFPQQIDVIFISSPDAVYAVEGSDKIADLARECCVLLFNDVTIPRENMSPVKPGDVQKALQFAKGKEKILVSCQAGISRSSALAYLIAAQEMGVEKAFEILSPVVHMPNSLVIKYGAEILMEPQMEYLMDRWKLMAR